MISYESAAEIAQVFAPGSKFSEEKKDAFIFRCNEKESVSVIILKRNGRIVPEWQYKQIRKHR